MRVVPTKVAIAPARSSATSAAAAFERERLVAQPKGSAAGDRRDDGHLVAVGELAVRLRVFPVDGVEKTGRLVAEPERGPDVRDSLDILELFLRPARPLAQAREDANTDHRSSLLDKVGRIRHK